MGVELGGIKRTGRGLKPSRGVASMLKRCCANNSRNRAGAVLCMPISMLLLMLLLMLHAFPAFCCVLLFALSATFDLSPVR